MFKFKIAGAIPQKSSLTVSVGFILIALGVRALAWLNREAANKAAKKKVRSHKDVILTFPRPFQDYHSALCWM